MTVDPKEAPISCCWRYTDGATVEFYKCKSLKGCPSRSRDLLGRDICFGGSRFSLDEGARLFLLLLERKKILYIPIKGRAEHFVRSGAGDTTKKGSRRPDWISTSNQRETGDQYNEQCAQGAFLARQAFISSSSSALIASTSYPQHQL